MGRAARSAGRGRRVCGHVADVYSDTDDGLQRKVVVLRHWLGLDVGETARELGLTEGTVKSHTSRGLASLQRALGEKHTI